MNTIELPNNNGRVNSIRVVYDDYSETFFNDLKELIEAKYALIEVTGFHENILKERKKAFKLKGGFSAKKNPFVAFFDWDNVPVKAFYSEANECTIDNIKKVLDSFILYKNINNESSSN